MEYTQTFQDAGQVDTGAENTAFFNGLIDQLVMQQNSVQDTTDQSPAEEEDSDFIKNLRAHADEQDTTDSNIDPRYDELNSALDIKIAKLEEMLGMMSLYDNSGGTDWFEQFFEIPQGETDYSGITPGNGGSGARNNYGNIKDTVTGKFLSYDTPEQGRAALIHQLNLYKTGKTKHNLNGDSTLYEAMAVYAPKEDNNNPKRYAEFIAGKMGISANTKIKDVDANGWADAIAIMEGNKNIDTKSNVPTRSYSTSELNFTSNGKYGIKNVGSVGAQIGNEIAAMLGYSPEYNSIFRDKKQQEDLIRQGWGAKNSHHLSGNAIDVKPVDWNKLSKEQQQTIRQKYKVLYHNNHYHVQSK